MSSTLSGPCRILQWTSKFARTLVESSSFAEVYASSVTIDHVAPLREFFAPFTDLSPGMAGLEGREILSTRHRNKKAAAGRRLSRHSLGIQQSLGSAELDATRGGPCWRPRRGLERYGAPTTHATIGLILPRRAPAVARSVI